MFCLGCLGLVAARYVVQRATGYNNRSLARPARGHGGGTSRAGVSDCTQRRQEFMPSPQHSHSNNKEIAQAVSASAALTRTIVTWWSAPPVSHLQLEPIRARR
ncbi:hypothetical protein DPEC_G00335810 [Dallia pectoralis]|uniref:Uncharacterized protein n=1 Tax=Dallia pectoralis TaxID=75939 RepID=A0ACC2F724_DALPE|nr:hypothetical protein DPEC_G00335810 [Dallia pectoralis]